METTTSYNPEVGIAVDIAVGIAVDMINDAVEVLVARLLTEGKTKHATLAEQYAALIVATIEAGE